MNLLLLQQARLSFIIFSTILLTATAHAEETGTSHNLYYLNKLSDKSFFLGRANLVTRNGLSDHFFGYVDANYRHTLTDPWSIEAD